MKSAGQRLTTPSRFRIIALAMLCVFATPPADIRAQTTAPDTDALARRGQQLDVYLMTMGPGPHIWEKFGHNALLVRDRLTGTDKVYNYGIFIFDEGFLFRFIRGDMQYWMHAADLGQTIAEYHYLGRSVWIQHLNLTPIQRARLNDLLLEQEDTSYPYDYYLRNCSTMVRDALDHALDGQIRSQTESIDTGLTYRWHNRRSYASDPVLFVALEFILGQRIDRTISRWDEMYLPMKMMEHLRHVRVLDENGTPAPLAGDIYEIDHQGQVIPTPTPNTTTWGVRNIPPLALPWFILTGLAIAAPLLLLGTRIGGFLPANPHAQQSPEPQTRRTNPSQRRSKSKHREQSEDVSSPPRRRDRAVRLALIAFACLWTGLIGLAGWFLLWGWTFTTHWAVRDNENLLHVSPLGLLLALLLIPALRHPGRARTAAYILSACMLAIALLGGVAQLLPPMDQANATIIALTLPAHAALCWSLRRIRTQTRSANQLSSVTK